MELADCRKLIDELDSGIVELFVQRMNAASDIADYKKRHGLPILNAERERQVLDAVAARAGSELEPYVRELYSHIFEISRKYQAEKCSKEE